MIKPSPEIDSRSDLAALAVRRGCRVAVEVGVDHGMFAVQFARTFLRGEHQFMVLVDPYVKYADMPWDRTPDMLTAVHAMTEFHGKYRFVRSPSPGCIKYVQTFGLFDFVFIDGDHSFDGAYKDIVGWFDALQPNGILAIHDYAPEQDGVVRAVNKFCDERNLTGYVTADPPFPTVYIYKDQRELHYNWRDTRGTVGNPYDTIRAELEPVFGSEHPARADA